MSTKMSQKEYLKKYLSGGSDKKKKKKDKKLKTHQKTVKIIDDDAHGGNDPEIDEELLLTGEDAPQIVGVIDVTGCNVESKWKSIAESSADEKRQGQDDDLWGKRATRDQSPERKPAIVDLDLPSRGKDGVQLGEKRKQRNGDQSEVRNRSPIRCFRRNSDQSPPRRRSAMNSRDQSPLRKHSQAYTRRNSGQSPPRRRSSVHRRRDSDQSPPRRRSRKNSGQSPPRRRSPGHTFRYSDRPIHRGSSRHDADLSPVRVKREKSSDQSPPRRNPFKATVKLEKPSLVNSPRRRRPRLDSDQSPVRVKNERHSDSPPPTHKPSSAGKMTKTLDGKRAGLQNATTLKIETEERRRNEDRMFSKMSGDISGRDAEVQVRQSSSYRRRRKELEEDPEVQRRKAAHEEQKKELYTRWNRGLKQIEAHQAKMSDDQYEGSKPLARYSNDVDLDEMLKQQERDDDPMLAYMRSKKKEQMQASNVPVMPKYKGSFPENRFNIPPGYRWDGVDRSNGYERKWFDVQNQKKALADEAYKYSTEDM